MLRHERRNRLNRIRGCVTKKWFGSREEALVKGQFVYSCKFCKGFHRTSNGEQKNG